MQEIRQVNAELTAQPEYKYEVCVAFGYYWERQEKRYREQGKVMMQVPVYEKEIVSGLPAGTNVGIRQRLFVVNQDWKTKIWFEGDDADLFDVSEAADGTWPDEFSIYNSFNAAGGNFLIEGTDNRHQTVTTRPLPAGEYDFTQKIYGLLSVACEHHSEQGIATITVTAPDGVLHEAFFDPVADGAAVGADASNGQLEPASFEAGGGTSTTIDSVTWESQQVRMEFSASAPPSGHHVVFIALDGTVALRLKIDDATVTVDGDGTALSWGVCSQPWEAGDKLMLRISESGADLSGATNDTECPSSGQ